MYSYSDYAVPSGGPNGHFMDRDSFGPFAFPTGRGGFGGGRGGFSGPGGRFPHSGHFHPGAGPDAPHFFDNAGQTEIWLAGEGADQDRAGHVDDEYDEGKPEGDNDEKPTFGMGKTSAGCHGRPGFGFHGSHRGPGGPGSAGPSCGPHRHGMRGGFGGLFGRRGGPPAPFGPGGNPRADFFFWPGVPDFEDADGFEDFGRGPHRGMRGGGFFGRCGRGGRGGARAGFRGHAGWGRHGFNFNPRELSPFVFVDTVESIDFIPPVDIVKDADGSYKIFVALAGLSLSSQTNLEFTKDILNVQVTGPSTLIVEGTIPSIQDSVDTNKQTVLQAERGTGRFSRTICFSPGTSSFTIEEDSLRSEWKGNGILELSVKLKSSEKKSVPVELA